MSEQYHDSDKSVRSWRDLSREFRKESNCCGALRHVVVYAPKLEGDPNGLEGEDQDDLQRRVFEWVSSSPHAPIAKLIEEDLRFQPMNPQVIVPDEGEWHFFYGFPPEEVPAWSSCWQKLALLSRQGVRLASRAGLVTGIPSTDEGPVIQYPKQWAGSWMSLVYRVARERRPDSLLHVRDTNTWSLRPLPEGVTLSGLDTGVFLASAYAAELLAESAYGRDSRIRWDEQHYRLTFMGQICMERNRKAGAQDEILNEFERDGWPLSVTSPFRDDPKKTRDTVDNLNKLLYKFNSPILFHCSKGARVISRELRSVAR